MGARARRPLQSKLIEHHGYIPETHNIWTEDHYCLTVHRIIGPKTYNITSSIEQPAKTVIDCIEKSILLNFDTSTFTRKPENNSLFRPPVLLVHGIFCSSVDWLLLGPQKALAYTLCQAGYDVWLANVRGNEYSKKHQIYTTKDKEFWDFSFHEIGYYDLPAIIDYVLEQTAYSELSYIGYSQGTTSFYVMGSERPEYNAKVKVMVSLAPVAFLYNQQSNFITFLMKYLHLSTLAEWSSFYFKINQVFPYSEFRACAINVIIRNVPSELTKRACKICFHLIAGFGSNQLENDMFPRIFGHFPAGCSFKQIFHYGQSILKGSFSKFDYGLRKNLKKYGCAQLNEYNLKNVTVPVAIFYAENDSLTNDVQKLIDDLPNVIETKKIEYSKFNHVDFIWGKDSKKLVFENVLAVLNRY
ncbi:PREDICTED: lipase 3-like [Polistes dominula]|uniref:Lipase n=1 Tax=Polistes dominula TaxID=743375 RepID=A0ABM1JB35_POLDO|nr:PREDICTED: lipase 3-like [Polistes dominula]